MGVNEKTTPKRSTPMGGRSMIAAETDAKNPALAVPKAQIFSQKR